MIESKQITEGEHAGLYLHRCTRCGATRRVPYEKLVFRCFCHVIRVIPREDRDGVLTQPAILRDDARKKRLEEHRLRKEADRQRKTTPCTFLGPPTGKEHKVGCVDKYLPEHACLCGERLVEIKPGVDRKGKPKIRIINPVAIPGGRCQDIQASRGQLSCLDCQFYRVGLLT